MSLINEALKKAQRERTEETSDPSAPTKAVASAHIPKRGKAHSANTMVLVGGGALVLVVVSVLVTVFLINRPAAVPSPAPTASPTIAVTPKNPPASSADTLAPTLSSAAPTISPLSSSPTETTPTLPTSTPATATADASLPPLSVPPTTPDAPVDTAPAPVIVQTSAPAPPPVPNERVIAFVEAIRVTGIRSSGSESRVLMNERVYRVNDVVDRTLGLKLTKVGADNLTFSDANGATYVKNF